MKNPLLVALVVLFFNCALSAQPGKKEDRLLDHPVVLRNAIRINTGAMEFAPVRYQSGIVYVTSREKFGPRDARTGETFYELYYADLDPDGMPVKPEPFSIELNSPMHESSVAFNRKGNRIFFTRNNMQKGLTQSDESGFIRMKIYEADRGPFDWENVRELPFNSDQYSCIHPTLSPDGNKLYFASDKPDGYGGFDLWFVLREGDGWSSPINLGPQVNTDKNEGFPFMHDSGVLFFSSDGYGGEGGVDLYMIDMSGNRWGDVINLGQPFNSQADDLSIIVDPDGRSGFFASNRGGGFGKDDIYGFEAPAGIQGIRAPKIEFATLEIREAGSGRLLPEVDIRVFENQDYSGNGDDAMYDVQLVPAQSNPDSMVLKYILKKEEELGPPKATTDRSGRARFDLEANNSYLLLVSKPGYTTRQVNYTPDSENSHGVLEIALEQSQCLTLNGLVTSEETGQPIPNVTIRILNECTNELTLAQSQMNGRFEGCLASGCDFTIYTEKPGFERASTQVTTMRLRGSRSLSVEFALHSNSASALSEPIREGTVIILEDLFYDFNKSAIRTREARALEGLAMLMNRYQSMKIELGAHTDVRGSESYNLKLSLKRAESAKAFLVQRGIAGHRIKAFGYGEAKPRNHCVEGVDCSEEEHQYNRRTEVIVTQINEPVQINYPEGERRKR